MTVGSRGMLEEGENESWKDEVDSLTTRRRNENLLTFREKVLHVRLDTLTSESKLQHV